MVKKRLPLLSFLLFIFSGLISIHAQQAGADAAINFAQLKQYAELSKAAYTDPAELGRANFLPGYQIIQYRNIPAYEVSYLIAVHEASGERIVSVRGTSNIDNALVDIAIKLQYDEKAGVKLHEGFAAATAAIYPDLQSQLDTSRPVHITGHSLGGAIAVILAMYFEKDGFDVGNIITFGQPKVTNLAGSRNYSELNLLRVVTPLDMVPMVPPMDPMDIRNLDIYWHIGTEVLINQDRTFSILEGVTAMLRVTKFTQRMLDEMNVEHHRIDRYIDLIELKMESAEQQPYENDFNLFNLFGRSSER